MKSDFSSTPPKCIQLPLNLEWNHADLIFNAAPDNSHIPWQNVLQSLINQILNLSLGIRSLSWNLIWIWETKTFTPASSFNILIWKVLGILEEDRQSAGNYILPSFGGRNKCIQERINGGGGPEVGRYTKSAYAKLTYRNRATEIHLPKSTYRKRHTAKFTYRYFFIRFTSMQVRFKEYRNTDWTFCR